MNQFTAFYCLAAIVLPSFVQPGYLSGNHHAQQQHQQHSGLNHYHHFDAGYPIQTIDLGTFVGKHQLKPNTIKLIRTVQVKIPVPYRVNVPHPLPYPVPVPKPYPVEVPKYIKVREQVPVYVPVHHHQHDGGGASGSGYSSSNNNQNYGPQLYQHGEPEHDEHSASNNVAAYQPQHGISHYGPQQQHNDDQGHQEEYHDQQQQQQQQSGEGFSSQDEYGQGGHHQEYHQDQQQPNHNYEHHQEDHAGAYSGKQLIYTNPRQGITAFALHDGHGNKGYHLEQDHETESDDGSNHSRVYKSEKKLAGSHTSGEPGGEGARGYYSKNYNQQVHEEVREVHEEGSDD